MEAPQYQTIGEVIRSLIHERKLAGKVSGLRAVTGTCCECLSEFETFAIREFVGSDLCEECRRNAEAAAVTCGGCGDRMTSRVSLNRDGGYTAPYLACDACTTAEAKEAERRRWLYREWCLIAPEDYRQCDRSRLPQPDKLTAVLDWRFDPDQGAQLGIFATGKSYQGKTRILYERCRRDLIGGANVMVFPPTKFGNQISYHAGEGTLRGYLDSLDRFDVILFDDFGKERWTERIEAETFGVIERRMSNRKRTYFTTNEDAASLTGKMTDPQRAAALINRIRERCFVVTF